MGRPGGDGGEAEAALPASWSGQSRGRREVTTQTKDYGYDHGHICMEVSWPYTSLQSITLECKQGLSCSCFLLPSPPFPFSSIPTPCFFEDLTFKLCLEARQRRNRRPQEALEGMRLGQGLLADR